MSRKYRVCGDRRKPPVRGCRERNALAVQHMPFARGMVGRYWWLWELWRIGTRDDARQAAYLGLLRAAELYRREEGAFTTFAFYHVRQALQGALRGDGLVYCPGHKKPDRDTPRVRTVAEFGLRGRDGELTPPAPAAPPEGDDGARELLDDAFRFLPPRYLAVVRYRMGGLSCRVVGKQMGLSPTRVAQIEQAAHDRLRELLCQRIA